MNGEAYAPFRRQKKARWQAGSSFQAINTQIMNALISTVNPVTMTSREIAELTGKAHFNVLVDVRKMLSELGEDVLKFQGIYVPLRRWCKAHEVTP